VEEAVVEQNDKPQPAKWPFDPMQPGDHEPVPAPQKEGK
jgi:hypothetical protein